MNPDPIARLRTIALALPEAAEQITWDHPTFRVRSKIFAICSDEAGEGPRVSLKAPPGVQAMLVEADGARFFVPPYTGHKGWIGVRLHEGADWDEVAALLTRSWRMTAPARLARTLPED